MGLISRFANGHSTSTLSCINIIAVLVLNSCCIPPCTSQGSSSGAVAISHPTRTFVIASILDEPYLMYRTRTDNSSKPLVGNDVYEGFAKDLADNLAARLNFTYYFDVTSARKYGHQFRNGSWNGIIELLMRPAEDRAPLIAIAAMTITEARAKVVSFSSPFMEFQFALLMKKPLADIDTDSEIGGYKDPHVVYTVGDNGSDGADEDDDEDTSGEEVGNYIFLRPMSPVLWGIFLGSIVLTVLLIFIVEKVISQKWSQAQEEVINRERAPDSKVTILPKPVGLCTNGIIGSPRTTAGRFLQIIFWVYIAIFVAAYIATFSADRIVDELNDDDEPSFDPETLQPHLNTIEELNGQSEVKFAALRGGSTYDYFMHTSIPALRRANSMMHSEDIVIRSTAAGVKKVRDSNGSFVFVMEEPTARAIAGHPPCDLIVSTEVFGPKRGYGIAMSKSLNEELVRKINLEILDMKEKEELELLEKKWFHDRNKCSRKRRKRPVPEEDDEADESSTESGASALSVADYDDDEEKDDDADHALCIKEMAGAFYILATALILALFVAAIEICCASRNTIVADGDEDKEIELQAHHRQPPQQR